MARKTSDGWLDRLDTEPRSRTRAGRCGGRLGAMAAALEISAQGLKRRMKALGLR